MSAEGRSRDGKIFVGRGVAEGARLFREWFGGLTELARRGETAAYCFVGGNLLEIMRTFDIPVTLPEINALQTGFRNVADGYIEQAEDYGYSPDICAYVKVGVGIQLRKGEHPMGLIPKPKLALLNNCCNTFIKWGEIWERTYDCPVVSLDYPLTRASGEVPVPGTEKFNYEKDYLKGQIEEVIEICEKITGKKFDIDKFREILKWSNDVNRDWSRCMQLNRNHPAVFNALTDATDPLASYAAGQLITHCSGNDGMLYQSDKLKRLAPEFGLDGVVFHPIKSCRTVSTGLADMRHIVSEDLGLPTLFIESDVIDSRVVAEAPMRNRGDAFFEGLISRRQQKAAAQALPDKGGGQ